MLLRRKNNQTILYSVIVRKVLAMSWSSRVENTLYERMHLNWLHQVPTSRPLGSILGRDHSKEQRNYQGEYVVNSWHKEKKGGIFLSIQISFTQLNRWRLDTSIGHSGFYTTTAPNLDKKRLSPR